LGTGSSNDAGNEILLELEVSWPWSSSTRRHIHRREVLDAERALHKLNYHLELATFAMITIVWDADWFSWSVGIVVRSRL
jgi:hypothetical protein